MKSRMIVGLLVALLVSAVGAVPTLAKAENGTVVTKGIDCSIDSGAMNLGMLDTAKARWIEKHNGQASKLKCRFKGLDMEGWDERYKQQRLTGFACPVPSEVEADQWNQVWSRLKVNHRGNGWLKCAFEPVV